MMLHLLKVMLRRGVGFDVKPEAERIDGKEYLFIKGWGITDSDSDIYAGEFAMLPRDSGYPADAPLWIASGDLEEFNEKRMNELLTRKDVSHVDVFKKTPSEMKTRSKAYKKAQKKRKKQAYLSRKKNR